MPRWTEESRRERSEWNRDNKPWLNSTGPKTEDGKNRSAMNSYKHGMRSSEGIELRKALALQNTFLKAINDGIKARRSGI